MLKYMSCYKNPLYGILQYLSLLYHYTNELRNVAMYQYITMIIMWSMGLMIRDVTITPAGVYSH